MPVGSGSTPATANKTVQKFASQNSKLLPSLFEGIDEGVPITVLHVGPALAETVDFFSDYRCKLHFIDLFAELPIVVTEDTPELRQQFQNMLELPPDTVFDLCLFWDIFNFLSREAVQALVDVLRPHLHAGTLGHTFSVHNNRARLASPVYGILQLDTLTCRQRQAPPEGYAPHSQRQLKELLHGFTLGRSVLLADGRLELLLQAKL